jgi:hypothetical protein
MTLSQNNAFTIGFDTVKGVMREPEKLTPYAKQLQRKATAAQRRELITAFAKGGITIAPPSDSDRRQTFRKAAI